MCKKCSHIIWVTFESYLFVSVWLPRHSILILKDSVQEKNALSPNSGPYPKHDGSPGMIVPIASVSNSIAHGLWSKLHLWDSLSIIQKSINALQCLI